MAKYDLCQCGKRKRSVARTCYGCWLAEVTDLTKIFWRNVKRAGPGDCWEWTGPKSDSGYGHLQHLGVTRSAHRVSYELAHGSIPSGLMICHACDNRTCVNPAHLLLGTCKENLQDMAHKGRSAKGLRNGNARLTDEQVAEIRFKRATGGATVRQLARDYNLSKSGVYHLIRGETRT